MKTPVALIIFNRPDTTKRVFEAIREAKPPKLLVIADGPRADRPGEAEKCAATRAIIGSVDWECEVLTNYSDVNLGCKIRVSSGLDWVFSEVEEAIILEDDCLPEPSFFPFCEELLERYRDDSRIAVISGLNLQFGRQRTDYSYYFSIYNHCWGWASWRRAWENFDYDMKLWTLVRDNGWLKDILQDDDLVKCFIRIFQDVYNGKINSWAYRWMLSCWLQGQLSVLSNINLISNIGFCEDATNTKHSVSILSNMATQKLEFPLHHPPFMIQDTKADQITGRSVYSQSLSSRVRAKIKKFSDPFKGMILRRKNA